MEIHSELNKKLVSDEYSCFTRQLSQLLKLLCSTLYRSMDHGCSRIWKNLEKILIICHQEFHNETLLRIKSLTFYILRKTWEKFLNFYPFWCFRDVGGRNPDGNREDNNFNSFNVLLIHKIFFWKVGDVPKRLRKKKKWIFHLWLRRNACELAIILNDFENSTTWPIQIRFSLTEAENPGIQSYKKNWDKRDCSQFDGPC